MRSHPKLLQQIDAVTAPIREIAADLIDADVAAARLLPGWTRGHVLATSNVELAAGRLRCRAGSTGPLPS